MLPHAGGARRKHRPALDLLLRTQIGLSAEYRLLPLTIFGIRLRRQIHGALQAQVGKQGDQDSLLIGTFEGVGSTSRRFAVVPVAWDFFHSAPVGSARAYAEVQSSLMPAWLITCPYFPDSSLICSAKRLGPNM